MTRSCRWPGCAPAGSWPRSGPTQLRFSLDEAERLLNQTLGLALPPEEIHALWQRTEGWAAGLYLAGLSLRGRKDGHTAGFIGAVDRR